MDIMKLLDYVVTEDGSDLHCICGEPPTVRLHGRMAKVPGYEDLLPEHTEAMVKQIISRDKWQELQTERGADFGFAFGDRARFRVASFFQKGTIAITLRQIPNRLLTFEQIGLEEHIKKLCWEPRGLVLVVGPTGSGKTTTLATMIDYINTNRDCHIITIEDPIEYYHNHKVSVVSQREVGIDVPSFDIGVIKSLRQDPDVILVGEMRDLSTISAAVRAAETGHLVFSTLHTTGAARTVDRIVDVFPVDQQAQIRTQLAGNLKAVISQVLIPKIGGKGRVAAFEIMIATTAIAANIRDSKTTSITSSIQTGMREGMKLLDDSLRELFQKGLIDRDEMLRLAERPDEILEKMGERKAGKLGTSDPAATQQSVPQSVPPRDDQPAQPGGQPRQPGQQPRPPQPPQRGFFGQKK